MNKPFRFVERVRSIGPAGKGVYRLIRDEPNVRVHLSATATVLVVGMLLGLSGIDWALLLLAIGMVWTAEAVNTAIERLCDVVQPNRDARIGVIKDASAAAVLIAAGTSALIGALVLIPRILHKWL